MGTRQSVHCTCDNECAHGSIVFGSKVPLGSASARQLPTGAKHSRTIAAALTTKQKKNTHAQNLQRKKNPKDIEKFPFSTERVRNFLRTHTIDDVLIMCTTPKKVCASGDCTELHKNAVLPQKKCTKQTHVFHSVASLCSA